MVYLVGDKVLHRGCTCVRSRSCHLYMWTHPENPLRSYLLSCRAVQFGSSCVAWIQTSTLFSCKDSSLVIFWCRSMASRLGRGFRIFRRTFCGKLSDPQISGSLDFPLGHFPFRTLVVHLDIWRGWTIFRKSVKVNELNQKCMFMNKSRQHIRTTISNDFYSRFSPCPKNTPKSKLDPDIRNGPRGPTLIYETIFHIRNRCDS